MPVVGAIFGGLEFANYFTVLGPVPEGFKGNPSSYTDLRVAGVAVLGWGQFITVLINFLILAFVIFLLVRRPTLGSLSVQRAHRNENEWLRVPVRTDYASALGLTDYCVASLEWNAVWCCERIEQDSLENLADRTAGRAAIPCRT